ncbi:MAG: hypothetical protein KatS3mg105_0988 [Gemmatales bacterium]|nr:MAG: hypothetical protein KatS3mg105_0988 [Gemmatales bacterium]
MGLVLVVALTIPLFFYQLGDRALWSSHEGRAAQNAQNILDRGEWLVPRRFDYHLEMQKPPLYYWLVAAVTWFRQTRVDAWSVRLPAACAALGCVLLVFFFFLRSGRPIAGLLASLVLATMVHFTWMARTGRIDMPLTLAISYALVAFCEGDRSRRSWPWYLSAYLAVACAVLLKGPIGFVLPAAVRLVWLVCTRRQELQPAIRPRFFLSLIWGVLLLVALTVPWFYFANQQTHGEFLRRFIWHHHFARALGTSESLDSYPFWYYLPRLVIDLLPWSFVLFVVLWRHFRHQPKPATFEESFGLVWSATVVVLLSCFSFKRADYLLPAYPSIAVFVGGHLEHWLLSCRSLLARRRLMAGFSVIVALTVTGWVVYLGSFLPAVDAAREQRRFAEFIRQLAPRPELVIFFRVEAHDLAFYLGAPLNTILEWENIDTWSGRPGSKLIIMPPNCAARWREHIFQGRLEFIATNEEIIGHKQDRCFVLMRTVPPARQTPETTPREKACGHDFHAIETKDYTRPHQHHSDCSDLRFRRAIDVRQLGGFLERLRLGL